MSILRNAAGRSYLPDMQTNSNGSPYGADGGKWGTGMVWSGPNGPIRFLPATEAMRLSAVYACLRLLSEAIATLPLDTFLRQSGTRKPYRPRPDYLSFQPPQGSRIDYLSQVMLSLLTDGNAYVLTPRDEFGTPVDLVVLDPATVKVDRKDGKVTYTVLDLPVDEFDLMHIKGMCLPGAITGLSPISYARESIQLGLNLQRFGTGFFENGAVPPAVIEAPDNMREGVAERFAAMWNSRHQGVGNAGRIGVLTGGAKLTKFAVTNDEAQFLQTRGFQVPDIARFYGVPPHLIADASNSTSWGSGLAEQNAAFGQFSLRPWTERIEDGHGRLLTTHGLPDVFVKLNMDALLRASMKDRWDAYAVAIGFDGMVINEIRKLEDLPPVAWGNVPWHTVKETLTGVAEPNALAPEVQNPANVTITPPPGGTP